jgi:beta-galactosidase
MKVLSRRDVLKSSILAPAAAAAQGMKPIEAVMHLAGQASGPLSAGAEAAPRAAGGTPRDGVGRERRLLDFGWRFHLGNSNDPAKDFGFGIGREGNFQKTGNFLDACSDAFDDSDWMPVDLPHDWAVTLPFVNDPELTSKGFYPLGRTYPETSVGWYRRVFELPAEDADKRVTVEFDGAYREAMVAFNGFHIGQHSGGYDPFSFDLTDFVNPGGRNVLLVRVDATLSDGWFYEGAGIYRHVWLVKTNPVHVKKWGTFVHAQVKPEGTELTIRTEVENETQGAQSARIVSTVLDPEGKPVSKAVTSMVSIEPRGEQVWEQQVSVDQPRLWSLEERNLYTLVTEVRASGQTVDRCETRFGIRSIQFDAEKGFFLNGKHVKVKGTCNHQDHAGLGVALPDAVQSYRVQKLQEMGCNALRTSHNPPTPELLDACDELGMLVLDETRMMSSNPEGLAQLENLVRRDRNHPSVFMWSMGNEEVLARTDRGVKLMTAMKNVAMRHDGSRPISIAPTGAIGTGGLAVCDVMGYNYMDQQAAAYHKAHADKPVIGTETVSAVGTRGQYITDFAKGYVSCYDPYTTTGRASAEGWWSFCDAQPWLAGGFVWTGFDYRGEPSPNGWPNISSQYGVVDTCGFPKDTFYYYQSWWTQKPVLHLFPHWNWPGYEGKEIAVWVHSNLDKVELFLNGQSLGAHDMKKNSHLAWIVKYAPGALEARGYKNGTLAMTAKRETTGAPAALAMVPNRSEIAADGEDVAMFAVEVRDTLGRVVPITENTVSFTVKGAGKLIGVGNGDPTDHESDKGSQRKAFAGLCMAIVQSTKQAGSITVEAASPGLTSTKMAIAAKELALRPQVAELNAETPPGPGLTGLWRPMADVDETAQPTSILFTLRQYGNTLSGTAEGLNRGRQGGSDLPAPISEGEVNGNSIRFRIGNAAYSGRLIQDVIELRRDAAGGKRMQQETIKPLAAGPAIGPAPDGSDPSRSPLRNFIPEAPLVLHRVQR